MYTYAYPRPALTIDCVVFAFSARAPGLKLLLIRRGLPPFAGRWALPGGFVHLGETLEDAARRELSEEAGLSDVYLEQLYTFGELDRDPRERVVSVAYSALVNLDRHTPVAATDAAEAGWFECSAQGAGKKVPSELAFDHARIIRVARERLRTKLRYQPIGFELLPDKFTLGALQRLYETVLETPLDKRNFRKKIAEMAFIVPIAEYEEGVAHRRAQLHEFDRRRYKELSKGGFSFVI